MTSKRQMILFVLRPSKFRYANLMVASRLYSMAMSHEVEAILIDMPRGFEALLRRYDDARDVLEAAVRLGLLYYSESLISAYEPVASTLLKIVREGVEVICYLSLEDVVRERELAIKVSRLVLRASVKKLDKQDLQEWLQLLEDYVVQNRRAPGALARRIVDCGFSKLAVLMDLGGLHYVDEVEKQGFDVKLEIVGSPYLRNPLEVMMVKHALGRLTKEDLVKLINEYVDYIRNYVVKYETLEEAHLNWSMKKAPWIKTLLPPKVLKDV